MGSGPASDAFEPSHQPARRARSVVEGAAHTDQQPNRDRAPDGSTTVGWSGAVVDVDDESHRLAVPPDDVFPYLTDPPLVVRWMGTWADLRPEPGGAFVVDVNGVPIRGHDVEVVPPLRVVLTWGAAGNDRLPPGSTTVEITLRPDGDGTVLELIHRDLPPEELPHHGVGWTHLLARLAIAAAGGTPASTRGRRSGLERWPRRTFVAASDPHQERGRHGREGTLRVRVLSAPRRCGADGDPAKLTAGRSRQERRRRAHRAPLS